MGRVSVSKGVQPLYNPACNCTIGKYVVCFFPGIHSSQDTLYRKCSLDKQETTLELPHFINRMSTGRQTGADRLCEEWLACVPFHLFRHLNFIYSVMRHCFSQWLAVKRPQKYSGLLSSDKAMHGGRHMGSLILLGFIQLSSIWRFFWWGKEVAFFYAP